MPPGLHGFNTILLTAGSAGLKLFWGRNEKVVSVALIRTLLTVAVMKRILVAAQIYRTKVKDNGYETGYCS